MRAFACAVLAASLWASPARADDAAGTWSPRVTAVSGDVLIFEEGSGNGLPAQVGTPVEEGDRIETGDDGSAELALEPESVMSLGAKTSFTVGSLDPSGSWFSLDLGSLVAKIRTLAEEGRQPLEVRTPTAVAAVRGTEFGVQVADEGGTDVGVYDEGKVAVTRAAGGAAEAVLTPDDEVSLAPGETTALAPHPLERLAAARPRLARLLARRAELRRAWSAFSPAQRRAARQAWRKSALARLRAMPAAQRRQLLQRFRQRRQRLQGLRKGLRRRAGRELERRRERLERGARERLQNWIRRRP